MKKKTDEEIRQKLEDAQYNNCPICGVVWENHKKECDKKIVVEQQKPRYYMLDLNNYTRDFLIEIVKWQEKKMKVLGNDKISIDEIMN